MEYNRLTVKLLSEGYTAEKYPDYVKIASGHVSSDNSLDNIYGGFEYKHWWICERTFKTPCGLLCRGESCMTGLYISGVSFTFEDDLATIVCPYGRKNCTNTHPLLRSENFSIRCNVHMTEDSYEYEGSVEELLEKEDERIRMEKIDFEQKHHGRTCQHHMRYDREKKKWTMNYDPLRCARSGCHGVSTGNIGEGVICPVLGRKLDPKRGNVYYDVKTRGRRYDLDGTLFEGQIDTVIQKGIRFLEHPVSMDICRSIVKLCGEEIKQSVILNKYHSMLFFAEYHGREFSVEIMNIRAEQKVSRDLMQDLQDIKDGIHISYDADLQAADTKRKTEKRETARRKKVARIEKRIVEAGYDSLSKAEQIRAEKIMGSDRIDELESERKEQIKPVQMSLFDLM